MFVELEVCIVLHERCGFQNVKPRGANALHHNQHCGQSLYSESRCDSDGGSELINLH